jgi:hypothetical protein
MAHARATYGQGRQHATEFAWRFNTPKCDFNRIKLNDVKIPNRSLAGIST